MTQRYYGTETLKDFASQYNAYRSIVMEMLSEVRTATPVEVIAVSNSGTPSPVGTVDIKPLVKQVDGNGNTYSHGVIQGVPYFRIQGGSNAVILDPQIGDIGMAVFCDRDISGVVSNKAESAPGTRRKFNFSDGLYMGGFLNGSPTQYVQFDSSGISIVTPGDVNIQSASLMHNGVNVGSTHVHSGVSTGTGDSGPPV